MTHARVFGPSGSPFGALGLSMGARVTAVLLVSLFALGCKEVRPRRTSRAVVELDVVAPNGDRHREVISETDYRRELARVRVAREGNLNAPPLSLELKQAILSSMIDRRLLMLEAQAKGVRASTTAVAREIAAMRKSLPPKDFEARLIQTYQSEKELAATVSEILTSAMLLKSETAAEVKISEEEVKAAWEKLPESDKVRRARVHAAQIVVATEEEGRAVMAALKKGQAFEAVAAAKSIAPEAPRGGDLGWFEAGVMPSVFDDVCFALPVGQISELTVSEYGYHIFKVLAAEPERPLTYEEARPGIVESMREERGRTAEQNHMASLRARAQIIKNEELIAAIE